MFFLILIILFVIGSAIFWFLHYYIYYTEKFRNIENANTNAEILRELKKQNRQKDE